MTSVSPATPSSLYSPIARRTRSGGVHHLSCRKLRKMLKERGRWTTAQRGLFGAEYRRRCKSQGRGRGRRKVRDTMVPAQCDAQGCEQVPLYVCTGCMSRVYCSSACQRADWK